MPDTHVEATFDPATAPKPNVSQTIKAKLLASMNGAPATAPGTPSPSPSASPAPTAVPATGTIKDRLAASLGAPKAEPEPKGEAPATPEAQINLDPKSLKEITRLSKQNRELSSKVKEYETSTADAATLKQARGLWESDPKGAIALLANADPSGVIEKLLAEYHLADTDDAKAEAKTDLELKVQELEAKIEADQKVRDAEKAEKAAESQKAEADRAITEVSDILGSLKENDLPRFPLCTKEANQKEAIIAAGQYAFALAKEKGIDPDTNDKEVLATLFAEAFEIVESEYREIGKRFSLEPGIFPPTNTTTHKEPEKVNSKPTNRPATNTLPKPTAKLVTKKPHMTVEESKAYYRDKIASSINRK